MTAERRGGKAPASAEERTQERSDKRGRERERLRLTNGAKAPLDGSPPAKRRREGARRSEGKEKSIAHLAPRRSHEQHEATEQHGYYKKIAGERRRAIGGRGRPRRSRPCGKFRREFQATEELRGAPEKSDRRSIFQRRGRLIPKHFVSFAIGIFPVAPSTDKKISRYRKRYFIEGLDASKIKGEQLFSRDLMCFALLRARSPSGKFTRERERRRPKKQAKPSRRARGNCDGGEALIFYQSLLYYILD